MSEGQHEPEKSIAGAADDQTKSGWDQKIEGGFVVLDFGSQLTQLIARLLRKLHYYSGLLPFNTPIEEIKKRKP